MSLVGDRAALETSEGRDGTRGTWGKRNAQKERPSGFGRKLGCVNPWPYPHEWVWCTPLLHKPLSKTIDLAITRPEERKERLWARQHWASAACWSLQSYPYQQADQRGDDKGRE